jgi:pimeloyl-ACP methyl ester carboxylesterase
MTTTARALNKFVEIDGLKVRYIEAGSGKPVILLHGASLGSSADVFQRNLPILAAAGFRAIAFDSPGFGLTTFPADHSNAYRTETIVRFMDAMGLAKAALIGHSQSGGPAVQIALKHPERVSHVVVLGTGSLLPPADESMKEQGAARQQPAEPKAADLKEPTLEDTKNQLVWNLFHTDLVNDEELAARHAMSVGSNFAAFVARTDFAERNPAKAPATPLWQKLTGLKMPLRLLFGRQDRSWAYKRAMKLKEQYPQLDLLILDDCKHMVPWDAAGEWERLAIDKLNA